MASTVGKLGRAAVRYARQGLAVLPLYGIVDGQCSCHEGPNCQHAGKHPILKGGVHVASNDPDLVASWWQQHRRANIGIATGARSGLVVVDVDPRNGGAKSMATAKHDLGPLPRTALVKTGGGGQHRYFALDGTMASSHGRLGSGIDIQADGAYVVAPPSVHISGKRYRCGKGRALDRPQLKKLPKTWLKAAKNQRQRAASTAVKSEVERVRNAPEGNRNDTPNRVAFAFGKRIAAGELDRQTIERELLGAANSAGLGDNEARATIESGLKAGERDGRNSLGESEGVDPLTHELAALDETDAGMARRFARRFKEKVLYAPGHGLLVFNGKVWIADRKRKAVLLAEKAARKVTDEAACLISDAERAARRRFSQSMLSKGAIDRILELAKSHLAIDESRLDRDVMLFNMRNGTIDLRAGEFREHRASDFLTRIATVDHDPAASCPTFERFINTALGEDADLVRFVQKAAGLSLTGNIEEHVLFFVYGPSRTGKSTFVNVFRDLIGTYGTHTPTETILAKQYDNAIPADLARLNGARMVTAIEANWNKSIDEARVKAMTGGEPITARFLRQDFFEFRPQFKLWMVANDFPRVRGTAGAFWERVRVIPFEVVIPEKDRDRKLISKLKKEAPGILNWAIKGCLDWQHTGLAPPEAVVRASGYWKTSADHVRKFVDENILVEDGNNLPASVLHEHYAAWCRQRGEQPLDQRGLKAKLESFDFSHHRTKTGSVWRDIKLRL